MGKRNSTGPSGKGFGDGKTTDSSGGLTCEILIPVKQYQETHYVLWPLKMYTACRGSPEETVITLLVPVLQFSLLSTTFCPFLKFYPNVWQVKTGKRRMWYMYIKQSILWDRRSWESTEKHSEKSYNVFFNFEKEHSGDFFKGDISQS